MPEGVRKARAQWRSFERNGNFIMGEEDDPANKLCFREDPFDRPDFAELAGLVFGPLLECQREESKP